MNADFLTGKTILVLSPQSWGTMMLAKHHYAIELAKRGNEVYYLNPPDNHHWHFGKDRMQIKAVNGHENLFIVDQQLYFPYKLKYHARSIFQALIKKQIRDILSKIGKPVNLIWSFDLGNLFPLNLFDQEVFKVFHPVDEPGDEQAILAARGANILFSVTREIIDKYSRFNIPSYFINHGLADEFLLSESVTPAYHDGIRVGLSGNFLRPDLDRKVLIEIVKENASVSFHFYGIYEIKQSNIGAAEDDKSRLFIEQLRALPNTKFHGVFGTADLAKALNSMDALLICYDMQLDQSKGTNYHKVMEYLSTGKVVISNNISTYREFPEMIRMNESRDNNKSLPFLFRDSISHLDKWNSPELQNRRRKFAAENTYHKQFNRIVNHISEMQG